MGHYDPFRNRHKFQDDIWGQIRLNDLERDVIDSPEFQRLFRTSQLGFVEFVYHCANHTRGAHSIGACRIVNRLINRLIDNSNDAYEAHNEEHPDLYPNFEISPAERILIRLGALLHDLSHVPLSHDLEKKTHKVFYPDEKVLRLKSCYGHYEKHDDFENNPVLFWLLRRIQSSVLARILQSYSQPFWAQLRTDATQSKHSHLTNFVDIVAKRESTDWTADKNLLPDLLFHLLIYENAEEAEHPIRKVAQEFGEDAELWHLGPPDLSEREASSWHFEWYQPYRHDIIGNTLSADLIDYLTRDPQRLGTQRRVDLHLLSYYVLVNLQPKSPAHKFRCAIDLHDHKRGTPRTFLLNDLFRLLDLRHDIHEKAVMHRVVQASNAMLARGIRLLGRHKPSLQDLVGLNEGQYHALQSEDLLFNALLRATQSKAETAEEQEHLSAARNLINKLIERRVCRPLVIIPGDWAEDHLALPSNPAEDFPLRTLAAIADSAYYSSFLLFVSAVVEKYLEGVFDSEVEVCHYAQHLSSADATDTLTQSAMNQIPSRVIAWTAPYKQLYKDPAVVVALEKNVDQIDHLFDTDKVQDRSARERIKTAIEDADSKYASLWQLYVFISDGLYYSGVIHKLLNALPPGFRSKDVRDSPEERLRHAQTLLLVAFRTISRHWGGLDKDEESVEEKQKLLMSQMKTGDFQALLGLWVAEFRSTRMRPKKLSTVDVRHYAHDFALDATIDEKRRRPCRDSRYHFDRSALAVWESAEANPTSTGGAIVSFLKECGIEDPRLLSELEFKELEDIFENASVLERIRVTKERWKLDKGETKNLIRSLWIGTFPWVDLRTVNVRALPDAAPVEKPQPQFVSDVLNLRFNDRHQVRRWVLDQAKRLNPNVARRISEEVNQLCDILQAASAKHGRAVFDDFELRVTNESMLIWNDIRKDRLTETLKKKWNLDFKPSDE